MSAPPAAKSMIKKLVMVFWDCSAEDGIKKPRLGFDFDINTDKHTPVCCKKPNYGPHEIKIIMKLLRYYFK